MNAQQYRWVALDGTRNCRDLGGIRVKSGTTKFGRLFRSDALNLLSDADQHRLRQLQLAAIVDFRADFEIAKAPDRLDEPLTALLKNRPFLPKSTHILFDMVNNGDVDGEEVRRFMLNQYRVLTLEHTAEYRQVIEDILAANGQGVLFHCTSGKDRTGMLSAIILAAVGASDEEIITDYILTNGRIEPITFLKPTNDPAVVKHIMAAAPEYIQTALETMRAEFGSVQNYLSDALKISTAESKELRRLLVGKS